MSDVDRESDEMGHSWDSWRVEWGEDAEGGSWLEFAGGAAERLCLDLPADQMLVARISCSGGPSPLVPDSARKLILCAASSGDVMSDDPLVVRSVDGVFISSTKHGASEALSPQDGSRSLPHHWGQEAQAMAYGDQLVDWLNVETCEFTSKGIQGESESDGPFVAELHPDHNFVLSVSLGNLGRRTQVEMTTYQVVPRDETLLGPTDVDPGVLLRYLE